MPVDGTGPRDGGRSAKRLSSPPVVRRAAGAAAIPVASLAAGSLVSVLVAAALRAGGRAGALGGPNLPVWVLLAAHRVTLVVRAGVDIPVAGLRRFVSRFVDPSRLGVSWSVRLVPVVVLTAEALTAVALTRRLRALSIGQAAVVVAVSGTVHAALLLALASASRAEALGVDLLLVRAGLRVTPDGVEAAAFGFLAGAAFALAGVAPALAGASWRDAAAAWTSAAGWAGATLALAAVAGSVRSGASGAVLGPNVGAAALTVAHGASATVADPGGATRTLDYMHAPAAMWVGLSAPALCCIAAGLRLRARGASRRAGLAFASLWSATLAVAAVLLEVRVLADLRPVALTGARTVSLSIGSGRAALCGLAWGMLAQAPLTSWRRRSRFPERRIERE